MYCRNCGAEVPDTAKFCFQCGAGRYSGRLFKMTFEQYMHGGRLEAAGIPKDADIYENIWCGGTNFIVTGKEGSSVYYIYKIEGNGPAVLLDIGPDPEALLKRFTEGLAQ